MAIRRLTRLSWLLGQLPSLGYALVYLLLIPIFAIVYCLLPVNSFYHSTVQYESEMSSKSHFLRQALTRRMEENIKSASLASNGWVLDPSLIYVHSLTAHDDVISFRLTFVVKKHVPTHDVELLFDPIVRFPSDSRFSEDALYDKDLLDFKFVSVEDLGNNSEGPNTDEILDALFPKNEPGITGNVHYVKLSPQLSLQIESTARGLKGFPTGSENLIRMFYLSASTITTLGYGDITPITTLSRILVSVESIFGVVLVGLFLNALSFERSRFERATADSGEN